MSCTVKRLFEFNTFFWILNYPFSRFYPTRVSLYCKLYAVGPHAHISRPTGACESGGGREGEDNAPMGRTTKANELVRPFLSRLVLRTHFYTALERLIYCNLILFDCEMEGFIHVQPFLSTFNKVKAGCLRLVWLDFLLRGRTFTWYNICWKNTINLIAHRGKFLRRFFFKKQRFVVTIFSCCYSKQNKRVKAQFSNESFNQTSHWELKSEINHAIME